MKKRSSGPGPTQATPESRPEQKLIERFTLAKDVWLREFVEIYIRRDLNIELTRRNVL